MTLENASIVDELTSHYDKYISYEQFLKKLLSLVDEIDIPSDIVTFILCRLLKSISRIENRVSFIKTSEKYTMANSNETCCICTSSIIGVVFKCTCGHIFHSECILNWIQDQATCPLCRSILINCEEDYDEEYEHEHDDIYGTTDNNTYIDIGYDPSDEPSSNTNSNIDSSLQLNIVVCNEPNDTLNDDPNDDLNDVVCNEPNDDLNDVVCNEPNS